MMHCEATQTTLVTLTLNGKPCRFRATPEQTLLQVLQDTLFLTGAKEGCGVGECGACTVILNGRAVNACLVLAVEAQGATLQTIEGEAKATGELSDLQQAFIAHGAVQCGFCTPGMINSARELLLRKPAPSRAEITEAIAGNLCRCTGYEPIIDAIESVAQQGQKHARRAAP
jgi:carbon-monoxide dehydrogenase small subunit